MENRRVLCLYNIVILGGGLFLGWAGEDEKQMINYIKQMISQQTVRPEANRGAQSLCFKAGC